VHLTVIAELLIAVALGMLIGLQREWSASRVAGVRTFPLISLLGAICALLSKEYGGWLIGVGLLVTAAMLVIANVAKLQAGSPSPGLTTEVSALVMYVVGATVGAGMATPAIVATGLVAVLLQFKRQLHGFVSNIEEADLRAAARMALIGLVILPALPDQAYGPFGVLNPFRVWLMVVLIVGISLAAYVSFRLLGPRAGAWAAGLLGGLISSTATTANYAQASRDKPEGDNAGLAIVVTASAIVFVRVLAEIAIIAPAALPTTAPPLAAMLLLTLALGVVCQRRGGGEPQPPGSHSPAGLRTAIGFGLLYALVLLAVAFAKTYFGDSGLYVVAALSGLTDMDAITLSTMQLIEAGSLETGAGWRLILVAAVANLAFKAGLVAALGSRWLARRVALMFAIAGVGACLILVFWRG